MSKDGYHAEYYRKNKERLKRRAAERRAGNPEKTRQAVRNCWNDPEKKAKYLEKRAQWYPDYAPVARARAKKWREENPDRAKETGNARSMLYKTSKHSRKPKWLTKIDLWMIKEAYHLASLRTKITGIKWHVDHIIPLRGKTVSGLHVPTNLQVITANENHRKLNRFA